jgi:hypothetical protein
MPVYNAKSIPAEVHSSTKDPEVAAFLKTGPVLGAHKPIHEQPRRLRAKSGLLHFRRRPEITTV